MTRPKNGLTLVGMVVVVFLLILLAVILFRFARSGVKVGDNPALNVRLINGGSLNLADMKGKLVIVDFWATWCGPCMQETPHMVALYRQYHSQGLEVIGISLDNDPQAVQAVMAQKGLIWPMCMGTSQISSQWGVNSIPHAFLIGPDGKVLWDGHPAAGLDEALANAFKEHPPM